MLVCFLHFISYDFIDGFCESYSLLYLFLWWLDVYGIFQSLLQLDETCWQIGYEQICYESLLSHIGEKEHDSSPTFISIGCELGR